MDTKREPEFLSGLLVFALVTLGAIGALSWSMSEHMRRRTERAEAELRQAAEEEDLRGVTRDYFRCYIGSIEGWVKQKGAP